MTRTVIIRPSHLQLSRLCHILLFVGTICAWNIAIRDYFESRPRWINRRSSAESLGGYLRSVHLDLFIGPSSLVSFIVLVRECTPHNCSASPIFNNGVRRMELPQMHVPSQISRPEMYDVWCTSCVET